MKKIITIVTVIFIWFLFIFIFTPEKQYEYKNIEGSSNYYTYKNTVYYTDGICWGLWCKPNYMKTDADYDTFTTFSDGNYAKDNTATYHMWEKEK